MEAIIFLIGSVILAGILSYCFREYEPEEHINFHDATGDAELAVKKSIYHYKKLWKI